MGAVIGSIVQAILGALFAALRAWRQDSDRIAAHERAATAEAESETEDVIAEIADERSRLPSGGDARTIAARLRERRAARGPRYSEENPAD